MSTIYEFAILKVEDNKCQIRFDLVHPDGGDYTPDSHNFYLQILVECFEYSLKGYIYKANNPSEYSKSYKEHCTQLAKNSPVFEQLSTWRNYMFGEQIPITAAQYKEYCNDANAFEQKYGIKTNGAGGLGENYFYYAPINEQAVKDLAAVFINEINILKTATKKAEKRPYWWAEVEIEVSTPELLRHLEAGMFWDSALYEYY